MSDETPDLPCTGASVCDAPVHIHGCYADLGNCDSPEEHTASYREGGEA